MIRPLAIVFLYVILFALSRGILFSINSEWHHVSGTTIYKCTSLKSGKYTMQCDSDVSRVMFLRFYEAVEIDIYRKLTPHNIKVQLGECPAINSDMHVNVEVDVESCQVHFHLSYLSEIHVPYMYEKEILYQIVDKYKVHVSHPFLVFLYDRCGINIWWRMSCVFSE